MTVTIQRTSKGIKAQRLISLLMIVGGVIALGASDGSAIAGLVLLVGCLWFLFTIFLGWWNHS